MKTQATKASQIKREWHLFDAKTEILGRLSVKIAKLLMGKTKPYFVTNLDCGDYVVVVNADKIGTTGRKLDKKIYYRHSGYPGGFRSLTLAQQMTKDPTQVIYKAVAGMLPQNKLKSKRLARLKIFKDAKHDYEDKFKVKDESNKKNKEEIVKKKVNKIKAKTIKKDK